MVSHRTKLRPLLRWMAALTLLGWTGAQAVCQVHCSFSGCHDESREASCHAEQSSGSHHGDAESPGHQDNSATASCDTLKSAISGHTPSPLVAPDFSLLYTFAPAALALDRTAVEPAASFSRQTDRRDWMLAPAVYLGPAFRSLAPPVLR